MVKLHTSVEKLNLLLQEGKIQEAFDTYYGANVTVQVNGSAPLTGKEANRTREMIFLQEIGIFGSAEIKSVTFGGVDENVSMTEWALTIENKENAKKVIYRVNVQQWKDNKVIHERLYFCGDQKF